MEFWVGFCIAYFLAGALTLRMILSSHRTVHPDSARDLLADAYVFFVWPVVLTRLGGDQ